MGAVVVAVDRCDVVDSRCQEVQRQVETTRGLIGDRSYKATSDLGEGASLEPSRFPPFGVIQALPRICAVHDGKRVAHLL